MASARSETGTASAEFQSGCASLDHSTSLRRSSIRPPAYAVDSCPTTLAFGGLLPSVGEEQVRCNAGLGSAIETAQLLYARAGRLQVETVSALLPIAVGVHIAVAGKVDNLHQLCPRQLAR